MAYYPKSQIKPFQHTSGNPLINNSGILVYEANHSKIYIGYYYEVSNGKYFTGKTPQDGVNIRLIFIDPNTPYGGESNPTPKSTPQIGIITEPYEPKDGSVFIQEIDIAEYPNFLTSPISSRSIPSPIQTQPTPDNYKLGVFQRYFTKKNNELKYIEISKETYTLLQNKDTKIAWDLYSPLTLTWTLIGEKEKVYSTNKNMVGLAEQRNKWYGFNQFFREDYLKYYLEPKK